ncbi:MAG: arginine N-succinyltransferase [Bacteriovoracaceae bacterium]|nr:arginine N-succinyltransferase [Bacteriovoracaceae bacterium]
MFIIRSVAEKDLDNLFDLSSMVFFINLPNDKSIIKSKIKKALTSFKKPSKDFGENMYLFVLEDIETQRVVGASMIHAQHGTEDEPHFYLQVGLEKKFSETINTGFMHGTLKLGYETDGPTEIGGLVVHPDFRQNKDKLGKQLSFARFLFMGHHPERFKETVHSELMPPLDKKGNSPLWEAIGRRFMNMGYLEADKLSRDNKEFILNLFPSENIYQTLLPVEARNAIGKVGKDTLPVKKMLENIGFKYIQQVDPFDGGPHYRCKLADIKPVKELFKAEILITPVDAANEAQYLIEVDSKEHPFLAMKVSGILEGNKLKITKPHPLIKNNTSVFGIPL